MGSAKKPPTPAPGQRSIASFFSPVTKSDANASARGVTSAVSTAMGKRLDADAAASARRDEKENVPLEVETTARARGDRAIASRGEDARRARGGEERWGEAQTCTNAEEARIESQSRDDG